MRRLTVFIIYEVKSNLLIFQYFWKKKTILELVIPFSNTLKDKQINCMKIQFSVLTTIINFPLTNKPPLLLPLW